MNKRDQYIGRLLPLAEFKVDLAASLSKAGKTARGRPGNESVQQASEEKEKRGPSASTMNKYVRIDQVLLLIIGAFSQLSLFSLLSSGWSLGSFEPEAAALQFA